MNLNIRIVNQSPYVVLNDDIRTEVINQVMDLKDKFSGPVVIRDIPGREGTHFVISCGQIWSYSKRGGRIDTYPHRLANKTFKDNAYISVGGLGLIHRVIANVFIPNDDPDNKTCINHKDEVKCHNYVIFNDDLTLNKEKSNLEWCTYSYNNGYGTHALRMSEAHSGENSHWYGKPKSDAWKAMMVELNTGENNPMYGKGYLVAGENNPFYGKHHSKENRVKCGNQKRYKNKLSGHITTSSVLTRWIKQGKTTLDQWELIQ